MRATIRRITAVALLLGAPSLAAVGDIAHARDLERPLPERSAPPQSRAADELDDGVVAQDAASCPDTGLCIVQTRSRHRIEARSDLQLVEALASPEAKRTGTSASAHALTELDLTLIYELHSLETGCQVQRVGLRLHVDMQLPRLADDVRASAQRRQRWRHALEGLGRHERGHVDIALEHARRLLSLVEGQPIADDCASARRLASRQHLRTSMRHALAQQLYDQRTGSGARQGSVLALPTDMALPLPGGPAGML